MAKKFRLAPALLFYALFSTGLVYFVIAPSMISDGGPNFIFAAAFFGLVAYGTYDLTNRATIKDFPLKIVVIDMVWGALLACTVAVMASAIYTNFI